jgi:hypothetical protein
VSQKLLSQFGFIEVADLQTPAEWVRVGGVNAINNIRSGQAQEVDVSDLSSLAKEYVLGLTDNGSMDIAGFYDPEDPGQIILETLRETQAANDFRVGVRNPLAAGSPTGYTLLLYSGRVSTFPISFGVDQAVTFTSSIRITGAITKA